MTIIDYTFLCAQMDFGPVQESLADIIKHTAPDNKRVLAVAGYGYPLEFLVNGAKKVVSFEVDHRKVAWNLFLRESIQRLSYEESRSAFIDRSTNIFQTATRVLDGIESSYKPKAYEAFMSFLSYCMTDPQSIPGAYPHLFDETAYNMIKKVVQEGGWEIYPREALGLLEDLEQNDSEFDVIYFSSIRNWMLERKFHLDILAFEEQYDKPLGVHVCNLLSDNGVFYEALIGNSNIPEYPIRVAAYPSLDIQIFDSVDPKAGQGLLSVRKRILIDLISKFLMSKYK